MRGRLMALFIAACCCGCTSPTGPSGSNILGDWTGLMFSHTCCVHWNVRIVAENGRLTGKACLTNSQGMLAYDNLPVTVERRHQIAFVDPIGHSWTGTLSDESIFLVIDGTGSGRPLYRGGDYCASGRH